MDTTDPPCDFDVFVAQRHGISRKQAQRLIQSWLTHYRPLEIREAQVVQPATVIGYPWCSNRATAASLGADSLADESSLRQAANPRSIAALAPVDTIV
jgi:hypothetical protein